MDGFNLGWMIGVAALVWNIVNSVWTRYVSQQSATSKDLIQLATEQATLRSNLTALEQRVDQMPTNEAVHALQLSMSGMQGDIRVVNEQLKPISNTVRRIDEYLMNSAGKTKAR